MKKFANILFITSVLLFGCDSILDEEPVSIIDPERFYSTETDAVAAIAGVYHRLLSNDAFSIQIDIYFGVNHDLLSPTRILGAGQQFYAYNWDESTPRVRTVWQRLYQAVNDANLLIAETENADFAEEVRREIIAEGTFLRGFTYYYLTAMYGDVPYITAPTIGESFTENATAPRVSANEIRQNIVSELIAVENDLPAARRTDFPQRATQWAAKCLKMKCYLWLEDYAGAKATAQDIIDNSGHSLLPDYADIFVEDNEFNNEIIFTFDYLTEEVPTNRAARFSPRGQDDGIPAADRPPVFALGFGFFTMYESFAKTFDPNDLRRSSNIFDQLEDGTPLLYNYVPKQWRVNDPRADTGLNYKFYRMADVYLNLAEAENELNGPTQIAYDAINEVRNRAGLAPLSGLTQESLRDAIRRERAWELVGEGNHRKMDLLRWGTLGQALQDRLAAEQADPDAANNLKASIQRTVDNFADHKVLLPIPTDERLLNTALTQNPGYN